MTGGQALVRWLEQADVDVVFGCCGHGNIGFLDALIDSRINYISCPHEQIAVHAADAYFRITHKVGVVTTTIGPGIGNTLNGVMDASADCSSVLIISGDTIRDYEGTDSFQEVMRWGDASQSDIFRPVVKRVWRVRQPHMLLNSLARAWNYAQSDSPGPVLMSVAMDLFTFSGAFEPETFQARWPTGRRSRADPVGIEAALSALEGAERPVIYAGGGVLLSDASDALVEFAERFNMPVVTSMIGQSAFPNTHRLYAGNSGSVGTPMARWALNNADLLVAVGTRFGEIDCCSWLPEYFIGQDCSVVQIDINPNEIGKTYAVAAGIVGDARSVLRELLDAGGGLTAKSDERAADLVQRRSDWFTSFRNAATAPGMPLEVEAVIADVQEVVPDDGIVLAGSGIRHQVGQYYQFSHPRTHLTASGHGTMGWVTAAAIGAKVGRPECSVVGLVGDGDFRSLSESVGVAVEAGVAPVWLVLNNASYNVIGLYQKRHYGRTLGTDFLAGGSSYSPDYARLAEAYGAVGRTVRERADLKTHLREALSMGVATVIDVPVTPTPHYLASGYWDANSYLANGWNAEPVVTERAIGRQ
jgi:acetolactate synthase-1/2/3 large subunit